MGMGTMKLSRQKTANAVLVIEHLR